MKYVATMNQAGYLPEIDPLVFDTPRQAWGYLREEHDYHADNGHEDISSQFLALDYDRVGTIFSPSRFAYSVDIAETHHEERRTRNGSREHFAQVINAHVPSLSGKSCRCGAPLFSYREHIANVWLPHSLPAGWIA